MATEISNEEVETCRTEATSGEIKKVVWYAIGGKALADKVATRISNVSFIAGFIISGCRPYNIRVDSTTATQTVVRNSRS